MRILYAAIDQPVPGTVGGSVHVQSVAEGLARRGHEVHVAAMRGGNWPPGAVTWHEVAPPLRWPMLRWTRSAHLTALARAVRADVVIERYYNFGGEGIAAAARLDIPAVLEVNAPIVDYPGSIKRTIDRGLLIEPLRRWRDRLVRRTSLFVTPSRTMLPAWVARERILETEWGADTERFRPDRRDPPPFVRDGDRIWTVFAGAFRSWHGAIHIPSALARLHRAGERRLGALLIGDGPERIAAERVAEGIPAIQFVGRVPHAELPRYLAHADVGVAPFDPDRHPPLQLGFFWSPLKIFEYMAAGLPVVAPRLPRLAQLVAHDREGLLYDPKDPQGLDKALVALTDPVHRQRLGAAARDRAVREFSWDAHCAKLEARLQALLNA